MRGIHNCRVVLDTHTCTDNHQFVCSERQDLLTVVHTLVGGSPVSASPSHLCALPPLSLSPSPLHSSSFRPLVPCYVHKTHTSSHPLLLARTSSRGDTTRVRNNAQTARNLFVKQETSFGSTLSFRTMTWRLLFRVMSRSFTLFPRCGSRGILWLLVPQAWLYVMLSTSPGYIIICTWSDYV